jgi:hypothetical protein
MQQSVDAPTPKALADLRAYLDSFWEQALAGFKAAAKSEGRKG